MLDRPMVVVLAGPSCSGKSTAGAWLAAELAGVHLEVDAVLTAIIPGSDRCLEHRNLAYEIVARAIQPILDRGLSAVLDCTYSKKEYRQQIVDSVPAGVPLVAIEFVVSVEVALERFRNRRDHHAIDLTAAIVAEKVSVYPHGSGTTVIDSESGSEEIRAQILAALTSGTLDPERWISAGI